MRLATIGRKSGQERTVIIGYLEDDPNLIATAMNGWDEGYPAWWLNLEAPPTPSCAAGPAAAPRACALFGGGGARWGPG